jgi:APA family basic amino acid/polyamine antiporter
MSGWVSLTAGFSAAIAGAAIAFSKYFATVVGGIESSTTQKIISVGLVIAVTALHAFDTKLGGRVQAAFTTMKVTLIVVFVIAGFTAGHGDWSHFASQGGGLSNMATASFGVQLMYVSFAYSGWNAAAYIAGEVEKPEKTLPRALLLGTGAVMALYVLLNVIYFYALPSDKLAGVGEVGAAAAVALFGTTAGNLITSLIALALVSAVSAMVMAGPRVYASMAEDGALPRVLARHSARGVPTVAVVTQGALAIAFVLLSDLKHLIEFVGFSLAIFAALAVGALFILRRRGKRSAYRAFAFPVTPLAFIALSAWIAYAQIKAQPKQSAIMIGILAFGAVLYALMPSQPAKPEPPEPNVPKAKVISED